MFIFQFYSLSITGLIKIGSRDQIFTGRGKRQLLFDVFRCFFQIFTNGYSTINELVWLLIFNLEETHSRFFPFSPVCEENSQ